jgi:hypothetical protein
MKMAIKRSQIVLDLVKALSLGKFDNITVQNAQQLNRLVQQAAALINELEATEVKEEELRTQQADDRETEDDSIIRE